MQKLLLERLKEYLGEEDKTIRDVKERIWEPYVILPASGFCLTSNGV